MPGAYLFGWDADNSKWVKMACDEDGKLIIDQSMYFEDPPTDGEEGKGPSSNWAFDHAANPAAHHIKFTSIEHDTPDRHALVNLDPLVCSEAEADGKISDHAAIADAHHERYTDAEAVAAVGYNGTKYWSVTGNSFNAIDVLGSDITKHMNGYLIANEDGMEVVCQVILPHGAVVTSVKATGNAAAESANFWLTSIKLSDKSVIDMATAKINSTDTSISSATIDNQNYAYYMTVEVLDTNDELWGATITYTL